MSGSRKHQVACDPFPVDSANPCPADAEDKVDDEGARALAEALRENSTLATLALGGALRSLYVRRMFYVQRSFERFAKRLGVRKAFSHA